MLGLIYSPSPLELTRKPLQAHWGHLQEAFRKLPVPHANGLAINLVWSADLAAASLTGPLVEPISRERGGRVLATPLFQVQGSTFWLSWLEKWNLVVGTQDRWRFRESGVTVFQGERGAPMKPQLFRAEWPGFTEWSRGVLGWQAPGAGQPHWQFDALADMERQFARAKAVDEVVRSLLTETELQEFGVAPSTGVPENLPDRSWTRMHFAAHARWSSIAWGGDISDTAAHVHAPKEVIEIRRWLTASILYLRNELSSAVA